MKSASVLCLLIVLSGCASQTIEPTYYLLRSDQNMQSGKLSPSRDFSLGTVEIAAYLDQPGLVMETADAQMRAASQNLWAEPIYDGVRNFLTTEIAQASGSELLPSKLNRNSTVVNIRIDQLHGTQDGTARLVAYWWLVRGDEVLALNRFADSQTLQVSGYSALVDAEKNLLAALARQIAASLVNPPT
ncbi:MAG: ABC-type transport auxiliary lipoprotein family protein [Halioglobus sp.]